MGILYSPSTNSFYDLAVGYKQIPEDAKEVDYDRYLALLQADHGQEGRLTNVDGNPVVVPSNEQALTWDQIRFKRDKLLRDSDYTDVLSYKTREGAKKYNAWQRYRQDLRDITKSAKHPSDIVWPDKPSFD